MIGYLIFTKINGLTEYNTSINPLLLKHLHLHALQSPLVPRYITDYQPINSYDAK